MKVTEHIIADLQASLRDECASVRADQGTERYYVGSVWFGDWFRNADRGCFGTCEKPNHNAAVSRRSLDRQIMTLAPVTTNKHARQAVSIPRGTIPGGKFSISFLLPRIKLQARRQTLDAYFQYRCRLSEQTVRDMVTMMKGAS
jgi:hypothetical protein